MLGFSLGLGLSSLLNARFHGLLPYGPLLDMNFAEGQYFGRALSDLTVSRASSGYAGNSAGVWTSFANNVPRITDLGLLIEEGRTNSLRNNSMQGAVAGVFGSGGAVPTHWAGSFSGSGLTHTIVDIGTENGIDYIEMRVNGTTSGSIAGVQYFDATPNAFAISPAQVWAQSAFVKLVAGSFANVGSLDLTFRESDSGGVFLRQTLLSVLGANATLQRFSGTTTVGASAAQGATGMRLGAAPSAAIDFTIRIGWPQTELGAFATSPIRTTSATATRASDNISQTTAGWYDPAGGSFYSEGRLHGLTASNQFLQEVTDGTTSNELSHFVTTGGSLSTQTVVGGASQANPFAGSIAAGALFKGASRSLANNFQCAIGGVLGTPDVSGSIPAGITTHSIGRRVNNTFIMNGYLRRIAYWSRALSDTELQAVTT